MAQRKRPQAASGGHVGVLLAAVAAIAAGVYFFATKQGNRQRVALQDWVIRAERDVMKRLENVGEVNKDAYEAIVDAVLANYQKAKKVNGEAIEEIRDELNAHWDGVKRETKKKVAKAKRAIHKRTS